MSLFRHFREFLRFGRKEACYQFKVLPFGLVTTPPPCIYSVDIGRVNQEKSEIVPSWNFIFLGKDRSPHI